MKYFIIFLCLIIVYEGISQTSYNEYSTSEVLLHDNFADNRNNWALGSSENVVYRAEINNRGLMIKYNRGEPGYYNVIPIMINEKRNWQIETEIKNSAIYEMMPFGLIFGFDNISKNGYQLTINNQIAAHCGDIKEKEKTYSDYRDMPAKYHKLTVRKIGEYIYYYLNELNIHTSRFKSFYGNGIGFYAYGNVELNVKYLKVSYLKSTINSENTTNIAQVNQKSSKTSAVETNSSKNNETITSGNWSNWYSLVENSNIQYSLQRVDYYGTMYALAFKFRNMTNKRVSFNFRYGIPGKASVTEMLAGKTEGKWYQIILAPGKEFEPSMLDMSSGLLSKNELEKVRMMVKDFKIEEKTFGNEALWSAGIALGAYFIIKEVGEFLSTGSNSNNSYSTSKDDKIYVGSQVRCIGHWQGGEESGYYGRVIETSGDKYKIKIDRVVVKGWTQTVLVGTQCTGGYDLVLFSKDIDLNRMKAGKGNVIWVPKNCVEKYTYRE